MEKNRRNSCESVARAAVQEFVRLPRLAECIRNPAMRLKGPWKSVGDVEIAVAEYVDWFNHRRLYGQIGLVPPAEYEATHRDE